MAGLKDLAALMPEDTEAYRLSQVVDENSGTYRVGELYAAVYDAMGVGKPNAKPQPKTTAKPNTESYNTAPTVGLSNITPVDIEAATKSPTVNALTTANTVGDGSPVPKPTSVQAQYDRDLADAIEAATAGVEGGKPNLPQRPVKPLDPETARLNEIATAAIEGRKPNLPVDSSTTPAVDENGETEYNSGDTIGVQTEKQPLSDKELYDQYSAVLQELAPSSFEEFQHIRNTEQWNQLEEQYKTLSMYKMDSGSMTAKEILELDGKVYTEKCTAFSKRYARSGNIAGAYIDGDTNNLYFAHSRINSEASLKREHTGNNIVIGLKNNRRFHYTDVHKENGESRGNTFYDTEAKLFEYFADLYEQKPFSSITMLSERGMCDSCRGVMEQFKKQFPDVTINVVSNKSIEGNVWGWREE